MNKKYLFCVVLLFLILPHPAFASLPVVKVYYQYGERTTEYITLDTDDLDYSFNKYYFRIDEDLTKYLSVMLNYIDYRRDYVTKDVLDNKIKDYLNSWDYYFFKEKDSSLKLDFNFGYREKIYENKERLDFNRTKVNSQLTYRAPGVWWGAVRGGVDYYNFVNDNSKDRYIYFENLTVKKHFDDERLTLIGNIKFKQTDFREKSDRNEIEVETGMDIKTGYNLFKKISLRWKIGERNTIEDEEYEEEELDFDYKYTLFRAKSVHQLAENLQASLRGEYREKRYDKVDYDYDSFLIGNRWELRYYLENKPHPSKGRGKRKRYIQIGLDLLHAETGYDIRETSSYDKNGAIIELAYKMWGRWSYSIELGGSQYMYESEEKDKHVYHVLTACSQGFFNNRFKLNLEYRYQIKDYLSSDKRDVYQHSFLIGGEYRF